MSTTARVFTKLFVLFFFITLQAIVYAQPNTLDPKEWAKALSITNGKSEQNYDRLISSLIGKDYLKVDSARVFSFLNKLEKAGDAENIYFKARFNSLKAVFIYLTNIKYPNAPVKSELKKLLDEAIDLAYKTDDDYFIAFASETYSTNISHFNELGLSIMYAINVIELHEKNNQNTSAGFYQFLAERLYKIREYKECIKYAMRAVALFKKSDYVDRALPLTNTLNTVALGYHRQQQYDSALKFYDQAYQIALQAKDTLWMSIVSGNVGQVYYYQKKYDTAYTLLINDYKTCKASGFFDDAANSLQWAARVNLALGNKTQAVAEVRNAFALLQAKPNDNYLKNIYFAYTEIFREMGVYDSAFYYNNLYSNLNDSLEKTINTSSTAISKARLNDKASRYNIETLNKAKRIQVLTRNIIIVVIVLLSLFTLLLLNRKQLQTKMAKEKAEQENKLMEQEIAAAREQMKMFMDNIVEKTALIEKLEYQKQDVQNSTERQGLINELSNQTILTEDDWIKFKTTFEKIHPGFFKKLKDKVADITIAEQRMASLTKLNLTTRQIASMLGISVASVHKTRQRLRQRIQTDSNTGIDDFLAAL